MFVVALTRRGPATPIEAEAAALAPLLGKSLYELRLALAAPLPAVLLETPDAGQARGLLATLRERGHGAVACDKTSVSASAQMVQPKNFRFDSDTFVADEKPAIAYSDIVALLRAQHVREDQSTDQHTHKKFSLGRAALSGGLVNTRSVSVTERRTSQEREQVLYLMNRRGSGHVLLRETRLRYGGLGAQIGRSTAENFATMLSLFRERAPAAAFDDRLLRLRGVSSVQVSGTATARTVTTSNDADVDLAAHLLTLAIVQAQA